MNEKMKKAWNYVKEHKLQIALAAATAVGGVVLCKSLTKTPKIEVDDLLKQPIEGPANPVKLILPGFDVGLLTDAIRYENGTTELWLEEIPLSDMGKLGETIMEHIPDISADDGVWALLSVTPNKVET